MRSADIKADNETPYRVSHSWGGKVAVIRAPVKRYSNSAKADCAEVRLLNGPREGRIVLVNLREIMCPWTDTDQARWDAQVAADLREDRINDRLTDKGFIDTTVDIRVNFVVGFEPKFTLRMDVGNLDVANMLKALDIDIT